MLLAALVDVRVNEVKGSIMILATCALVTQRRRRCTDRVRNEDRWNMDGEKERKMMMFALPSSLSLSHSA